MNRSYSKIRHIQEANQRLEKRIMSEQVQQSGSTTTDQSFKNPFKDQSLLDKFIGKQFNTYSVYERKKQPDEIGNKYGTFEIKNASYDVTGNNDVVFELDSGSKAYFNCDSDKLGIEFSSKSYYSAFAPSLIKELKQTFCTVGSGGISVPKVDYPTP